MTPETSEEAARWFLVLPIPAGAKAADMFAEHPGAWLLDTETGQMFSPTGWPAKSVRAAEAA